MFAGFYFHNFNPLSQNSIHKILKWVYHLSSIIRICLWVNMILIYFIFVFICLKLCLKFFFYLINFNNLEFVFLFYFIFKLKVQN